MHRPLREHDLLRCDGGVESCYDLPMLNLTLIVMLSAAFAIKTFPYGEKPPAPEDDADLSAWTEAERAAVQTTRDLFFQRAEVRSLPEPSCGSVRRGGQAAAGLHSQTVRNGVSEEVRSRVVREQNGLIVRLVYWTFEVQQSCASPCPCTCDGRCAPCARTEPSSCVPKTLFRGVDATYGLSPAGKVRSVRVTLQKWGLPPSRRPDDHRPAPEQLELTLLGVQPQEFDNRVRAAFYKNRAALESCATKTHPRTWTLQLVPLPAADELRARSADPVADCIARGLHVKFDPAHPPATPVTVELRAR